MHSGASSQCSIYGCFPIDSRALPATCSIPVLLDWLCQVEYALGRCRGGRLEYGSREVCQPLYLVGTLAVVLDSSWFFCGKNVRTARWSPYLYSYTLSESRLQVSLSSWNRLVSTLGWCLLEPGVLPRPNPWSPAIGAVVSPATPQVPDPTHLSLAPQEVGLWSWWQKSKILVQFSIEIYQTRCIWWNFHHQLAQDCIEISRILSIWFATLAHVCGRWCSLHTARQHGRMATRLLAPKKQSSAKSWATEQHLIEETAPELMWRFVGARCFFFIITLRSFMFCFARSQVAAWEVKT